MAVPPEKSPLTDSAWFWLLMFCGVAMLGIIAVGPKYFRRQARAEQRYANRVQTWQHRQLSPEETAAAAQDQQTGRQMEAQGPRATLAPLAAAVAALMAAAAGGLMVTRRRG